MDRYPRGTIVGDDDLAHRRPGLDRSPARLDGTCRRFGAKLGEPDSGEHDARRGGTREEDPPQHLREKVSRSPLRKLVQHRDGERIPETGSLIVVLAGGGERLRHRGAGAASVEERDAHTANEQRHPLARREVRIAQGADRQVQRARRGGAAEDGQAAIGVQEGDAQLRLDLDAVLGADAP